MQKVSKRLLLDPITPSATDAAYGVVADGVTDTTDALKAFFAFLGSSGVKGHVPAGDYLIGDTITWTITAGFEVECDPDARFIAKAGFPVDKKLFQPSTTSGDMSFRWKGGVIDGRNMPARVSGAPDCLYISSPHLKRVVLDHLYVINNNDRNGTAGDSCIFLAEGEDYTVVNCKLQGAVDSGLYISGDNAETVGRRIHVTNNTITECGVAVISKRGFQDHTIDDNFLTNCDNGIIVGGIGDVGTTGRKGTVHGNELRNVTRGIEARISDGLVITGNRIEDWGIDKTGAAVLNYAIRVAGSKRCNVGNNILTYTSAVTPNASSGGIVIERRTELGVDYDSTDNHISDNVIFGIPRGIVETTGANNNLLLLNSMTSVTTRNVLVGASTMLVEADVANTRFRVRSGGSGSTPASTANVVFENDVDLILNLLAPSTNGVILLVGDEANNGIARIAYNHVNDRWAFRAGGGTDNLIIGSTTIGFYGATPVAKPTVSGSRGGNAALASLLTALASQGLVTDSSTA